MQRIKLAIFRSKITLNILKVTESDVIKDILNLSSIKATRNGDISAKILKQCLHLYKFKIFRI